MNADSVSLLDYFNFNKLSLIHKWEHYFPIYEKHFAKFVGKKPRVLEIGVSHGGSLQMWSSYFGAGAAITGIDIDERCKHFSTDTIQVLIGDQGDRSFLRSLIALRGPFDIVIDDGGHTMVQQTISFEELFPSITPFGVYLAEDLHTSYWPEFGGGYKREGTFIEFAKAKIEELNGYHIREGSEVTSFTRSVRSLSFYDSIVVFEKEPIQPPIARMTGTPSF